MTEHYDVVIATPGRSFHGEYVRSLVATLAELNKLGITYTFSNQYSSFVPVARELTALDIAYDDHTGTSIGNGRYTCGKIFWIDSDMKWKPEDFLKLYRSDENIISGLYALSTDGLVAMNRLDESGIPQRVMAQELMCEGEPIVAGGVGFGFLCVKAEVWNSIPRPWFLIGRLKLRDSETRINAGEDYSWCGRAQQQGYEVKVDPLVKLGHMKEIELIP